eukprot:m.34893 g.34893  ORF g.34893 m.34893 type:complete len:327 (+) comp17052_c0_seq1:134-1114(+)
MDFLLGYGHMRPQSFEKTYVCNSVMMMPGAARKSANVGGKIFLPPNALDTLTRLNIEYPMIFSVSCSKTGRKTHSGVLEFIADPGHCFLPGWMMRNLASDEGDMIIVKTTRLPLGKFAKLQPQSTDFLDINNPKAVLEKSLSYFSCLTEGDIIAIDYNNKTYEIMVLEVLPKDPSKGITIVETDLEIDFAPPLGYVEPKRVERVTAAKEEVKVKTQEEREQEVIDATVFQTFTGGGRRLDGKQIKTELKGPVVAGPSSERGRMEAERLARAKAAEARFQKGKLSFNFPTSSQAPPKKEDDNDKGKDKDDASATASSWGGAGRKLRD